MPPRFRSLAAVPFALFATVASVASVAPRRAAAAQPAERGPDHQGVDVAWTAPGDCPSSADLRSRVASRVPADADVRVRGRVDRRAGRYHLVLEIATASSRGERALDAGSCDALASSAAVVIAMSVAPAPPRDEPASDAPPATTPAPTTPSATGATPTAPPWSAPADRADDARPASSEGASHVFARAQVVGDSGLLPSAALGGGLALGVALGRHLTLEATAELFASQDGTVDVAPSRGASFRLLSGGARACWALTRGVEVAPCLGLDLARVSATGFGAARVSDAAALLWGPEATVALRIPVGGPVALRAGLGALVPMSRQSFVISAAGTVHTPALVALVASAGPEVRF